MLLTLIHYQHFIRNGNTKKNLLKVRSDKYFSMGTPIGDVAGFSTSYNVARPSIKPFHWWLPVK